MRVVLPGDVWEAENRVFYIIKVLREEENVDIDRYEYLELTEDDGSVYQQGHLTIRASIKYKFGDLWKKIV